MIVLDFVQLEERGHLHHSSIPVSGLESKFSLDDLLTEAPVPELSEQALGILEVLIELIEESSSAECWLIDQ